ncbi:protein RER1-like [Watersipora subatra]|uniref:protein RER1-like n=1 Tax=Watersipora subatra TaxID=2589382 RepID=UPI00355C89B6
MLGESEADQSLNEPSAISKKLTQIRNIYQTYLDRSVQHVAARWIFLGLLILSYIIKIVLWPGWYIVTYALGIYLLSLFLAFLTPKVDPALQSMDDEDGPSLPTRQSEEFRPFIRRLPEFKFWLSATKAMIISLVAICFKFTDIPVFWPILLVYFCILLFVTLKKQIKHMLKYNYVPMTRGKTVYSGKPDAN